MNDRITVQVRADDPVSEAGVAGLLRPFPEIRLLHDDPGAAVTVVTTDAVDPAGHQLLRTVQQSKPSRIVLLVPRLQDHQVGLAAECGIAGIMWRAGATAPRLMQVIQAVARGDGHIPPDLQERLLRLVGRLYGGQHGPGNARMAEREIAILRLVSEGCDTSDIAHKLGYSERTIKNVLHDVMNRYQLSNRAHAVAYALRNGLI
ncbi:response regulator transcription factor [Streptomyces sp. ME19-01-6]|uniref:helix-turn-helix transcriptional regulator n=1 Tax=Streptomyces sp. ME19-01-6 TaxID=3028686 RepID=UPI0029B34F9F|nr:response regulator transcription factor [Streptomyces sp. ME19-01-6]MDX3224498.1 response regulator transcription factor [Streptomyces sp. ME19-01-6]